MPPPKYYIKKSLFIWSFLIKQSKLAALPIGLMKKEEIDESEGWDESEKEGRIPPSHHSVLIRKIPRKFVWGTQILTKDQKLIGSHVCRTNFANQSWLKKSDRSFRITLGLRVKADLPEKMPYQQYPLGAEKTSVKANLIFWKGQDKVNLKLENIFFYFVGLISSLKTT